MEIKKVKMEKLLGSNLTLDKLNSYFITCNGYLMLVQKKKYSFVSVVPKQKDGHWVK